MIIYIAGSVEPIRISEDWKHIGYAANANGFINVCHFSDIDEQESRSFILL